MSLLKKYEEEAFKAITSLGTTFFYVLLLLFLLVLEKRSLALKIISGLSLGYLFIAICRVIYFKERPKKESYSGFMTKIIASSFPSMHACTSMYVGLSLAAEIKKPLVTLFLVLLSLIIGYSRVYLKKHDWIDISFGFLLGWIMGSLNFFFFR